MNNIAEVFQEEELTQTSGIDTQRKSPHRSFPYEEDNSVVTLGYRATAYLQIELLHPVWVINIEGMPKLLKKPIALRLQSEGGRFYAENDTLDICGYGSTRDEALQDAIGDIAYYYSYYSALNDDDVIGHGRVIKERYGDLFE